jgi:hypothetical protein
VSEPGLSELWGRTILRHADAGGRPIDNAEFCLAHGRSRVNATERSFHEAKKLAAKQETKSVGT